MLPILGAAAIGAGSGLLGSLFNKQKNPVNAARPYLEQIPQVGREHYNPYIQQGLQAGQQSGEQFSQMSQDPMAFLNKIMQGYHPSEGYNFASQQALKAANNSAASAGMAGTENDQTQRADLVRSLMGQDMQQFIQNILGIQGTGLQGQQHQFDTGYNASSNLADYLGNAMQGRAESEFQGADFKNQNRGRLFNSMLQGAVGGAGGYQAYQNQPKFNFLNQIGQGY